MAADRRPSDAMSDATLHSTTRYVGRFAPSPTGLLHAGSLVAALASWLDARAHDGRWLVRIEDIDTPRCVPGAGEAMLGQLAACGMLPDEPPWWQSRGEHRYADALQRLVAADLAYPCGCSRRDIELASGHRSLVYPGTCRPERGGLRGRPGPAVRMNVDAASSVQWTDRRLGRQHQDVPREVGDFVIHRADGLWAYQLAVVVDDAAQGITHVVRGEDLADNTARQVHLQRCLGLPTPRYHHTPLVLAADGEKLSKQNGARPLDLGDPLAALRSAGAALGLSPDSSSAASTPSRWLDHAVDAWAGRWMA
ncbi:MAG: gluQ [Rhizobacter sp.]|nr:gluQ [Rhizobacter sp.]